MENNETKINEKLRELTDEELRQVVGGTQYGDQKEKIESYLSTIDKSDFNVSDWTGYTE